MFKNIYFSKDIGETGLIISLLKENGYHPLDLQTAPHVSLAGADILYYVQIPDNEFEAAKDLLKNQGYKNIIENGERI